MFWINHNSKLLSGLTAKSMRAAFVLTLGLVAMVTPRANAQFTYNALRLRSTYLQGQPNTITATCAVANCTANPTPIFVPALLNVQCPKPAGQYCELYIHLESQDITLTQRDTGMFRFWVDNAPANPGPVDAAGYFTWDNNDGGSVNAAPFSHSYAVVAHVYNQEANQNHTVEVDVNCIDANGSALCTVSSGLSTLEVNVY